MSLNPLTYQPHSNLQQRAAMFAAYWFQLRHVWLVCCDRSVLVKVITHTNVGLKCLREIKIQILCDHVDHTRFHIVGPTMFVNLIPAKESTCLWNYVIKKESGKHSHICTDSLPPPPPPPPPRIITCKILHESSVARFPANRLHELTPIADAYQWNAHDHLE